VANPDGTFHALLGCVVKMILIDARYRRLAVMLAALVVGILTGCQNTGGGGGGGY
jgi:uncharacterized membrane protein YjjB (DUF3815 family)